MLKSHLETEMFSLCLSWNFKQPSLKNSRDADFYFSLCTLLLLL